MIEIGQEKTNGGRCLSLKR